MTGDVFEGVTPGQIAFVRVEKLPSRPRGGLSMEFGGPWKFYQAFWTAHGMPHLAQLLPIPEVSLRMGKRLYVPLVLNNDTDSVEEVRVTAVLPQGWTDLTGVW
jgi:hypothetical protein